MLWFKSKKEIAEIDRRRGYEYAAVELLKGESPKKLYTHVECAYHFQDSSPFESGMVDALADWKKKTGEEYDYM